MNERRTGKAPPPVSGEAAPRAVVPAVDRAMTILALLESRPEIGMTVSDIARAIGIPKSTTFNICGALADGQLLRRARDGFQLGPRLVQLGSAYVASVNIVREFFEACRIVPPGLRVGIQLATLEGFDIVYVAQQDNNSGLLVRVGSGSTIGRRIPANCSASGKALLAKLPPPELERRLRAQPVLAKLTRKSIGSETRLLKAVSEARESGYGTADEEVFLGTYSVAKAMPAPVAGSGHVAITITSLKEFLTGERQAAIRSVLDRLVDELRARV